MADTPAQILARADKNGALALEDQEALAAHIGVSVRQLPPQLRGGLMGIFGYSIGKDSDSYPIDDDGPR